MYTKYDRRTLSFNRVYCQGLPKMSTILHFKKVGLSLLYQKHLKLKKLVNYLLLIFNK